MFSPSHTYVYKEMQISPLQHQYLHSGKVNFVGLTLGCPQCVHPYPLLPSSSYATMDQVTSVPPPPYCPLYLVLIVPCTSSLLSSVPPPYCLLYLLLTVLCPPLYCPLYLLLIVLCTSSLLSSVLLFFVLSTSSL